LFLSNYTFYYIINYPGVSGGVLLWRQIHLESWQSLGIKPKNGIKMDKKYGLFFDLDGTLIESEPLKARALSETISFLGGTASAEAYRTVMGKSYETVKKYYMALGKIKDYNERFDQKFQETYLSLLDSKLEISPNTLNFLQTFKKNGFKLAVVSSAKSWMVQHIFKKFDIARVFDLVVTAEDVTHHKPHPAAYQLCLSKLFLDQQNALVFEDTEFGIASAVSAGIKVIGKRHAYNVYHDFSQTILTINSFEELNRSRIIGLLIEHEKSM
jgi:HAD superfamily hydrolase (TIGR01509 family)